MGVGDPALQEALGKVIRRRREARHVSQEQLGFQAGLHRTYVSMLERGLRNPSLTVISKLSGALGTTMASLLGAVERDLR